ncbi:MAG: shikimate dehydrogenase [Blastocatellia bacterium]|nr:shikimate dehydrogenase [Blastocatellia bacterium]
MINTTPRLCGSLAIRPSKFGVRVHNAGFEALNLPFRYISMQAESVDEVVPPLRALNFRGFAVSMPFKEEILRFVDEVSEDVRAIGACNTVVNEDGRWVAHNTDWRGFADALAKAGVQSSGRAVVVGSGGVARAILYALKVAGWNTIIVARNTESARQLRDRFEAADVVDLESQKEIPCDLIVNATPVGDYPGLIDFQRYPGASSLMDVVINPPKTALCEEARSRGLTVVPGWSMLLYQALYQFRLYTKAEPPLELMEKTVMSVLEGS